MKKLDRTLANKPECLTRLSHPTHDWKKVTTKNKRQIWRELHKFQGQYCAYCESPASQGQTLGHIEHFFHKGKKPDGTAPYAQLTFDWNNLFGCCDLNEHCGHFKDRILPGGEPRAYEATNLIKPDVDNPEDFLQFLPSGEVQAKTGLEKQLLNRATETIRVLNLKATTLMNAREGKIYLYQQQLLALDDLTDEEAWQQELAAIKTQAMADAHSTAIKQTCFI